jgi:hypothetical protein
MEQGRRGHEAKCGRRCFLPERQGGQALRFVELLNLVIYFTQVRLRLAPEKQKSKRHWPLIKSDER